MTVEHHSECRQSIALNWTAAQIEVVLKLDDTSLRASLAIEDWVNPHQYTVVRVTALCLRPVSLSSFTIQQVSCDHRT